MTPADENSSDATTATAVAKIIGSTLPDVRPNIHNPTSQISATIRVNVRFVSTTRLCLVFIHSPEPNVEDNWQMKSELVICTVHPLVMPTSGRCTIVSLLMR
jgi:hypothetical protein